MPDRNLERRPTLSPGGAGLGTAISYAVLAAYPEWVKRAVILAVPHPSEVRRTIRKSPKHILRSFHWFLLQLPWLPEALCKANNFAFIHFLWRLWSPAYDDRVHEAQIKRMLAEPGAMEAALAYYRAMFRKSRSDPALQSAHRRRLEPIAVPIRVLCGSRDMRREMLPRQADLFTSDYEWHIVEGAAISGIAKNRASEPPGSGLAGSGLHLWRGRVGQCRKLAA